jgi:hypothetical protein
MDEDGRRGAMKKREKKRAKQGRLKIRVVLTAGAVGLLGAACNSATTVAPSALESPCQDCVVTNQDGGHDGGVDAGQDAGTDGGPDGVDAG